MKDTPLPFNLPEAAQADLNRALTSTTDHDFAEVLVTGKLVEYRVAWDLMTLNFPVHVGPIQWSETRAEQIPGERRRHQIDVRVGRERWVSLEVKSIEKHFTRDTARFPYDKMLIGGKKQYDAMAVKPIAYVLVSRSSWVRLVVYPWEIENDPSRWWCLDWGYTNHTGVSEKKPTYFTDPRCAHQWEELVDFLRTGGLHLGLLNGGDTVKGGLHEHE